MDTQAVPTEFDIVIAGGGVIGSACAYFLSSDPSFSGSIGIVEPDPSYRAAASTLSAGSIRQQFSTPVNINLSAFGMNFLRRAPRRLAVDGAAPDFGLIASSYLYLATERGRPALETSVAIQRSCSVSVALHERRALAARYPWLNVADLAAGADTSDGEGWFDGHALLGALRAANQQAGVHYVRDRAVELELSDERRVSAVRLEQRGRVGCRYLVNATGTRSRELAASAGIALPVFARKRCVFVFTCPDSIPRCPLIIDPSGLWFRPERDRFICGIPPNPDLDVSPEDFEIESDLFESVVWPLLANRVPAFEAVRLSAGWAGHYDYNVFDQNAFVGPVPGIPNLLLASGFSGHGLQQAPGIGRGLAEYIIFGEYRSLDLAPLSYDRYLAGRPLRELNVI